MDESYILTEGFLEELNSFGISIDTEDIHWRCSFSQGDGLCFDIKSMTMDEIITWLKAVIKSLVSEKIQQEKDPKQNGGILGIEYVNQLLQVSQDINNLGVLNNFKLYTAENRFATHYCHEKTREIEIDYSFELTAKQYDEKMDHHIDNHIEHLKDYFKNWYIEWCKKSAQIVYDYLEEEIVETEETEESTMNKYLVINMFNLTFIKQIETDIPEDTINNMDRDELEGTFELGDDEDLFTPRLLREKLAELQRLLDEDKFKTDGTYLLADYERDD